jgi:hypothetical protein
LRYHRDLVTQSSSLSRTCPLSESRRRDDTADSPTREYLAHSRRSSHLVKPSSLDLSSPIHEAKQKGLQVQSFLPRRADAEHLSPTRRSRASCPKRRCRALTRGGAMQHREARHGPLGSAPAGSTVKGPGIGDRGSSLEVVVGLQWHVCSTSGPSWVCTLNERAIMGMYAQRACSWWRIAAASSESGYGS